MSEAPKKRALRPLTVMVLVLGIAGSLLSWQTARGSVRHADDLLLRQDAVQGSLLLGSYVGQTPPEIAALTTLVSPTGAAPGWAAAAEGTVGHGDYSGLAVLRQVGGRLQVVDSAGTIRRRFDTPDDGAVLAALAHLGGVDAEAVGEGPHRWLGQFVGSPAMTPGFALYSEAPLSAGPISLSSIKGHPFSGIDAAVYVGRETTNDLLFATTGHLPLTGERAVAVISGDDPFNATAASLSTRVGSLSRPGGFILVMRPTQHLSGSASATMPWALLFGGLGAAVMVSALLELSERRRRRAERAAADLQERNAQLDSAMERQARTDARYGAMVRSSSDLTTVVAPDGRITYQSPSSSRLLGRDPDVLVGTDFGGLLHDDEGAAWRRTLELVAARPGAKIDAEWRARRANGEVVHLESRLTNLVDDPAVSGVVINSRDVSERLRLEDELRYQAFHDPLTGLANRALFQDRVEHALARLPRTGGSIGVLFLDLDDFKSVNDGRGHFTGDELLRAVAERLAGAVRAGDTLARVGGDEFAVLVEGSDPEGAMASATRVFDALGAPVSLASGEVAVRASIGVASTTDATASTTAEQLLRDADIAMYAAKSAGKSRVVEFHSGLHEQVIEQLQLEIDLARALDEGQLAMVYQPIVDLGTGAVTGVEALLRWHHPLRGVVMPGDFIPVAEKTGLIVPIGEWLLLQACSDFRELRQATGRDDLHLAVNISAHQLDDPHLVDAVAESLRRSGLEAPHLTLEITESAVMAHPDRSLQLLRRLKALGVRLSVDDFGTGYSSLSYLQRLPVDELKIDRAFVAEETGTPHAGALVHTIIRLAEDFGLDTVAEGIETEIQLERLRAAGCRLAQGYFFARPLELEQLCPLVAAGGPAPDQPTLSRSTTNTSVSFATIPGPGDRAP